MIEDWSEYIRFLYKQDNRFKDLVKEEVGVRHGMSGQVQLGESCGVQVLDTSKEIFIISIEFVVNADASDPFPMPFQSRQDILIQLLKDEQGDPKINLVNYIDRD